MTAVIAPATVTNPTAAEPTAADVARAASRTHSAPSISHSVRAESRQVAPDSDADNLDAAGYDARTRRTQIWERFCGGKSLSAIACGLGLDRATVGRHVHAIQQELADDERAIHHLALLQAVHAQLAIQSAAMEAYRAEVEIEEDFRSACIAANERAAGIGASPYQPGDGGRSAVRHVRATRSDGVAEPPPPYRAQRARLLTVASNAAWRAALLQGLLPRAGAGAPVAVSEPLTMSGAPVAPGIDATNGDPNRSHISGAPGDPGCSCTCHCRDHSEPSAAAITLPASASAPAPDTTPALLTISPSVSALPVTHAARLQPALCACRPPRQSPMTPARSLASPRIEGLDFVAAFTPQTCHHHAAAPTLSPQLRRALDKARTPRDPLWTSVACSPALRTQLPARQKAPVL